MAGLSLTIYVKSKLAKSLQTQMTELTNSEYALSLDGWRIDFFNRDIIINNIGIAPLIKRTSKQKQNSFLK